MDIKSLRILDPDTQELGEEKSIVPTLEDISYDDKNTLKSKLDSIDVNIGNKADSVHTHKVKDVTDFPTKISAFINDSQYVTKDQMTASNHIFSNADLLDTITPDMLTGFADKYTKSQVDNLLQNQVAVNKTTYALKVHSHTLADISDYVNPTIPTKVSQLSNDSGYITATYVTNLGLNTSTLHTHPNLTIINTITQTMLDGFADKYTKSEIDNKLSSISTTSGGVTEDDVIALINLDTAPKIHTHVISDVTELQDTLDNKAALNHIHTIDNITSLQSDLDAKAPLIHKHQTSDIIGIDNYATKVSGFIGQLPFITTDNSSTYTAEYLLKKVTIVDSETELAIAESSTSDSTIYDVYSNKVYKKSSTDNTWSEDTTTTIANSIGLCHFAFNQSTGKLFYIDESGSISSMNSNIQTMTVTETLYIGSQTLTEFIDAELKAKGLIS